jgi:hypothetical protein
LSNLGLDCVEDGDGLVGTVDVVAPLGTCVAVGLSSNSFLGPSTGLNSSADF